jgi:hypothetical protein
MDRVDTPSQTLYELKKKADEESQSSSEISDNEEKYQ